MGEGVLFWGVVQGGKDGWKIYNLLCGAFRLTGNHCGARACPGGGRIGATMFFGYRELRGKVIRLWRDDGQWGM